MSGSESKKLEKSPCSIKNVPVPELIACSRCGEEIEFWSDEEEISCASCGNKLIRKRANVH